MLKSSFLLYWKAFFFSKTLLIFYLLCYVFFLPLYFNVTILTDKTGIIDVLYRGTTNRLFVSDLVKFLMLFILLVLVIQLIHFLSHVLEEKHSLLILMKFKNKVFFILSILFFMIITQFLALLFPVVAILVVWHVKFNYICPNLIQVVFSIVMIATISSSILLMVSCRLKYNRSNYLLSILFVFILPIILESRARFIPFDIPLVKTISNYSYHLFFSTPFHLTKMTDSLFQYASWNIHNSLLHIFGIAILVLLCINKKEG